MTAQLGVRAGVAGGDRDRQFETEPVHHHGVRCPLLQPGGGEFRHQRGIAERNLFVRNRGGGQHIKRVAGGQVAFHPDELHHVVAAAGVFVDEDPDLSQRATAAGRERLREAVENTEKHEVIDIGRGTGEGRLERRLLGFLLRLLPGGLNRTRQGGKRPGQGERRAARQDPAPVPENAPRRVVESFAVHDSLQGVPVSCADSFLTTRI